MRFGDIFSSFYFSTIALSTVGFGDIAPLTPQGRTVITVAVIVGLCLIPSEASLVVRAPKTMPKRRFSLRFAWLWPPNRWSLGRCFTRPRRCKRSSGCRMRWRPSGRWRRLSGRRRSWPGTRRASRNWRTRRGRSARGWWSWRSGPRAGRRGSERGRATRKGALWRGFEAPVEVPQAFGAREMT